MYWTANDFEQVLTSERKSKILILLDKDCFQHELCHNIMLIYINHKSSPINPAPLTNSMPQMIHIGLQSIDA